MALTLALMLPGPTAAAENLAVFEVRLDGQVVRTWDRGQVRRLPLVEFTNRQGKKRTAVLLSTLLERSGVPMDRVAAVTVTGLGGDTNKGPSTKTIQSDKGPGQATREFRGDNLASALARAVVFYNPDRHWTLADMERADPKAPWDQSRVRKVRRMNVVLHRP